jgi:cytochrome c oxidase subunit 4
LVVSYRQYVLVWAALLVLTAATVTTAGLKVGRAAIYVALAIAATKSVLVLLYFMHLRYETRMVIKVLVPITVVALAIFIGLTYTDILYR